MMVPEEISLLVSSDPASGASNVSADGSSFEIQLEDGLQIPKDAINVNVAVEESTIWWVVPNVVTGVNDKMYIFGDIEGGGTQLFTITLPQGLYDLSGLNNAILRELEIAGARVTTEPLILLSPDEATQKVQIRFNYPNVTIDFSQPDTPREILGFDSLVYGPYVGAPQDVLAPNIAGFNTINYFLITSDLVQRGIRRNNSYNQVISQVLIDVSPGSQIISKPFNPARTNAQELAGVKRTNLRFGLTDENNDPVNTAGEFWTARIVIHYLRPFIIGKGR